MALPNRGYYLGQENATIKVLEAYSEFIRGTALALGGRKDVVDRDVTTLLEFETELAKVSKQRSKLKVALFTAYSESH